MHYWYFQAFFLHHIVYFTRFQWWLIQSAAISQWSLYGTTIRCAQGVRSSLKILTGTEWKIISRNWNSTMSRVWWLQWWKTFIILMHSIYNYSGLQPPARLSHHSTKVITIICIHITKQMTYNVHAFVEWCFGNSVILSPSQFFGELSFLNALSSHPPGRRI